jgi:eukaryotic-like serine/threonine-protein kinase
VARNETITGDCLSSDTLIALAAGSLGEGAADSVQIHLDSCPSCRRLLVAVSDPNISGNPAEDASGGDLPVGRGTRIGRYLVANLVGAGGMGAVYAARDPELDRCVAIKLLHHHVGESERACRLLREAQAMARLVHPNVVQVYDVGEHGSRTFIAMELVEGRTLRSWAQEPGRRSWEIAAAFIEAGRGLEAAHEAGLLHRDFKPDNVFIANDGKVKVGDFGLACPLDPAAPSFASAPDLSGPHTRSGQVGGTPAYLAPEVIAGGPPSMASDQFAFCVSLWEALYGQRPYAGGSAFALLEEARAGRVQPPPSKRAPAWLRKVVLRGLALDPAARYPSMRALLKALDRKPGRLLPAAVLGLAALAAVVVAVRPPPVHCSGAAAELAPAWGEARRAALAKAFSAGGQESSWPLVDRALSAFGSAWVEVHTRSCRATRIDGHQTEEVLQRRSRCLTQQREVVAALGDLWLSGQPELLSKAPAALQSLPLPWACGGDAPLNAPRMAEPPSTIARKVRAARRNLAVVAARLAAGDPGAALTLSREVAKSAKALAHAPLEAEALLALGRALKDHGDYEEAERTLQDATLAAVAAGHDQALAETMVLLARLVGVTRARTADGEVLLARATPVVTRLGDRRLFCELETLRGNLLLQRGDAAGAKAAFAGVLPVLEPLVGKDHPQVAEVHHDLFLVAHQLGHVLEARSEAELALQISERALPPGHLGLYPALMSLAATEAELGNLSSSHQLFERALRVTEKAQGPEGPSVAAALDNLAMVQAWEGDLATAKAGKERALRIAIKTRGPTHPLTAHVELTLGEMFWQEGSVAEAVQHLGRSVELREQRFGRRHIDTAEALALLGRARLDAGHPDGLAQVLEADQVVRTLSPNIRRWQHTAFHACEALLEAGRPAEASPHCQRMLEAARLEPPSRRPVIGIGQRLVAEAELAQGRGAAQRAILEPALENLEALGGAYPRELVALRFALARVLAGNPDPAIQFRSLQLARSALALAHRLGTRRAALAPMEAFVAARSGRLRAAAALP